MKSFFVGACAFILATGVAWGQSATTMPVASQQALVTKYCAGCHGDKTASGGFSWSKVDLANPDQNAPQAEKVIRKLRAGMMPPAGMPRPDAATLKSFVSSIETTIDQKASARPFAGAPELSRLNRTQYRNAIRDLLGLDMDVSSLLPPDEQGRGFDNISDALTVTPALVQGYVRAASKISREAVGDTQVAPTMSMYTVPKVVNQMRHVEGAPWGTRGGTSVMHNFPTDGEYTFKLTFYYDYLETLYGQSLPSNLQGQEIEVSIDGARVGIFKIDPNIPETKNVLTTQPVKIAAGPHRVSAAFIAKFDGPTEDHFPAGRAVDGRHQRRRSRTDCLTAPAVHDDRRSVCRDRSLRHTEPPQDLHLHAGVGERRTSVRREDRRNTGAPGVPPARERRGHGVPDELLSGRPQGRHLRKRNSNGCASDHRQSEIRFPIGEDAGERRPWKELPHQRSRTWHRGCRSSSGAVCPTNNCLSAASQGKLKDPVVLEREVRRMLADRRSDALVDNFAFQWLRLQTVKEADPDSGIFPNFTRNLGQSMTRETQAAVRQRHARGSKHPRSADGKLHVRRRSSGQALRNTERRPERRSSASRSPIRTVSDCSGTQAS